VVGAVMRTSRPSAKAATTAAYRVAAGCAAVLLASFVAYHIAPRTLGADEEGCGCFGERSDAERQMRRGESSVPEVAGVATNLLVALVVVAVGAEGSRYSHPVTIVVTLTTVIAIVALSVRKIRVRAQLRAAGLTTLRSAPSDRDPAVPSWSEAPPGMADAS
jgi:hypothetical protein